MKRNLPAEEGAPAEERVVYLVYVLEREDRADATPQDVTMRVESVTDTLAQARLRSREVNEAYILKYMQLDQIGADDAERKAQIAADYVKCLARARRCKTWTFGARFDVYSRKCVMDV